MSAQHRRTFQRPGFATAATASSSVRSGRMVRGMTQCVASAPAAPAAPAAASFAGGAFSLALSACSNGRGGQGLGRGNDNFPQTQPPAQQTRQQAPRQVQPDNTTRPQPRPTSSAADPNPSPALVPPPFEFDPTLAVPAPSTEPSSELEAMVLDRVSRMVLVDIDDELPMPSPSTIASSSPATTTSTTTTTTTSTTSSTTPTPSGSAGSWDDLLGVRGDGALGVGGLVGVGLRGDVQRRGGRLEEDDMEDTVHPLLRSSEDGDRGATPSPHAAATTDGGGGGRPPVRRFRVLPSPSSTGTSAHGGAHPSTAGSADRPRRKEKRGASDLMPTPVANNHSSRPSSTTTAAATGTMSNMLGSSGLLPRLSPPLPIHSPTSTSSPSPTSTIATAQMTHRVSADGTSLAIGDGGAHGHGGRKRRMLKKRHRRSHASIAGVLGGCGDGISMVTTATGCADGAAAVDGVGCLGGILPDLADIFGACGGGTDDVVEGVADGAASTDGGTTLSSRPRNGPSSGGDSSSFPDPFGLVVKASKSPRPTAVAGGNRSRSTSPVPPMLSASSHPASARRKRPSAPTPPGATISQSSVFDQRLDRLASGVQMPSTSTTKGRPGRSFSMPASSLVPKFRSSPLPFSANLHVTPQPRRASRQQGQSNSVNAKAVTGRRVRGGAKAGQASAGAGLPSSTGFGEAAAFGPALSRGSSPIPPSSRGASGGQLLAPPPTPSAPGSKSGQSTTSINGDHNRQFQREAADNGAGSRSFPSMPVLMMP